MRQRFPDLYQEAEVHHAKAVEAYRNAVDLGVVEAMIKLAPMIGQPVTGDVRPAILDLRVLGPVTEVSAPLAPRASGIATALEAELATQPRALRPAELIAAIDPAWVMARVTRIHQWTQAGGARHEVIDLGPAATPPPHAEARAS